MSKIRVLAVADPAVYVYTEERFKILEPWKDKVEFNIVPWAEYYNKIMETFQGKDEYDIVMMAGHLWLKDFVSKGYISEVSKDVPEEYDYEDILPVIREELKIDNKKYGYPSFCDGHILMYRKSKVGREPEEAISTDELIKLVKDFKYTDEMDAIALKAHPSEGFLDFLPYLRNEGIDVFDEKTEKPIFNCDKGVLALEKYCSLKDLAIKDTDKFDNDKVREAFQRKKVALAVTWGGQLAFVMNEECLEKEDVGFSALKTSWNVTWSFVINSKSKRKKLAEEFLMYLSSKEVDRIIGGYAGSPVRKSTYEMDMDKYPWYKVHLKLIENYAKPLPSLIDSGAKLDNMYSCVDEAFNKRKDIKVALNEAESRILNIEKE